MATSPSPAWHVMRASSAQMVREARLAYFGSEAKPTLATRAMAAIRGQALVAGDQRGGAGRLGR